MITRVRNRTGGFAAFAATQGRSRISSDVVDLAIDDTSDGHKPPLQFSKEHLVL